MNPPVVQDKLVSKIKLSEIKFLSGHDIALVLGRDRTEAGQPLNYLRQIFLAGWAGTDDVLVSGMLERERVLRQTMFRYFYLGTFETC